MIYKSGYFKRQCCWAKYWIIDDIIFYWTDVAHEPYKVDFDYGLLSKDITNKYFFRNPLVVGGDFFTDNDDRIITKVDVRKILHEHRFKKKVEQLIND